MHELEQMTGCGSVDRQDQPLPPGSTILSGRYRLIQLLHQRPRLNLYLGCRISPQSSLPHGIQRPAEQEPLVAIRELILTDLSPQLRSQIEWAASEEFISPIVLGSPHLPDAGDRVYREGERHYLILQLSEPRSETRSLPTTLVELLNQPQWPTWLDTATTLTWGIQLCRIVARLHRLGVILGDLDPNTILVDKTGKAEWSPILLVSWPPPPHFWPHPATHLPPVEQYNQVFPIAEVATDHPFAAPEAASVGAGVEGKWDGGPAVAPSPLADTGQVRSIPPLRATQGSPLRSAPLPPLRVQHPMDERSDVYSLGALLYLLLTHYAPSTALRRQQAAWIYSYAELHGTNQALHQASSLLCRTESMPLIPPRFLQSRLPPVLERVLLRALALDPAERHPSVFALAEALEYRN